ncbi:hypothetical protein Zmor_009513 [Zophobas morio]|uniref:Nose resistant-to-fluoxetine protein N-terminal domain-containing protein n=1 Tax=Zophobas morio TaxID=2755281 RepID=A0AA38MIY2_9CUCU|nr:hypothetical protein Zmor_009513 [Zophobas morio]
MFISLVPLLLIFSHFAASQSQFLVPDLNYLQIIQILQSVLEQLPNNECTNHFSNFVQALRTGETWALTMLDATAKPQAGILLGNIMHVGNYDECLEIDQKVKTNRIQGKYCTAFFGAHPKYGAGLSKLLDELMGDFTRNEDEYQLTEDARLSYGFCVPKACTGANLQNLADVLENMTMSPLHFTFDDKFCDGGDPREFSSWAIFAIVVFSLFALLLVFGTMYDVMVYKKISDYKKEPNLLMAFSVLANGKKMLSVSTAEGSLNCLNGLRVISMMWIVLAHSFQTSFFVPHVNGKELMTWKDRTENSFIAGSSMAVDTFFTISGLLVVYLYMKSQAKGAKFSLPMFYIHRILRLTPSLAMVVLFSATLLKHMGRGPFWPIVDEMFQKPCEENWWSTLIYLQIFINPDNQCVGQAWYLAVDTQMYFLSPLIFFPLVKWPKQTIGAIMTYVVVNCSYVFGITWVKHLGTTFLNQDATQYNYLYSPTHVRGTVYLIGMVCGYLVHKTRTNPLKLTKTKVTTLWLFSLVTLAAVVLGHSSMISAPEYNVLDSSFFNSLTRVGWAIALSVIIILCVNGYGGLVDSFLSNTIFNVLIRLNYSIYLLHLNVLISVAAQGRAPTYFANLLGFHQFWGDYMFSLGASVLWTLAFESPVITIERIIFNTKSSSKATTDIKNTNGDVVAIQIVNNLKNDTNLAKS